MERLWIASNLVGWVVAVAQALTLVAVLHHIGGIHLRRTSRFNALIIDDGPEIHSRFPELQAVAVGGKPWRSQELLGKEWVLLVVSPGCAPCEAVLTALRPVQQGLTRRVEFVVLVDVAGKEIPPSLARLPRNTVVILDQDGTLTEQLGLERSPVGLLVDREGVIRMKGVVNNRDQLEGLIQRRGRYIGQPLWEVAQ